MESVNAGQSWDSTGMYLPKMKMAGFPNSWKFFYDRFCFGTINHRITLHQIMELIGTPTPAR
jgi:hypothetical protein